MRCGQETPFAAGGVFKTTYCLSDSVQVGRSFFREKYFTAYHVIKTACLFHVVDWWCKNHEFFEKFDSSIEIVSGGVIDTQHKFVQI